MEESKIEREVLEKCGEVAQKNYKVFQEEWNRTHNLRSYSHFTEMYIHFNKKLNLCVYEGGIIIDNVWEMHVFNAYTNESLTGFYTVHAIADWDKNDDDRYDKYNKTREYYFEGK